MASKSKLTIEVGSSNTSTTLGITSGGRYKALSTNTLRVKLLRQPTYTSANELVYWHAVLNAVVAEIVALGG